MVPARLIALLLTLVLAGPARVAAGTIEGTVEVATRLKKRPTGQKSRFPGTRPYREKAGSASHAVDEVRHVVVYLVGAPAGFPPGGDGRGAPSGFPPGGDGRGAPSGFPPRGAGRGALSGPPPEQPLEITQKNREFIPFVTPVRVGSTVQFPNRDTIYHAVYSESAPRKFHLPEYPQGESRSVRFDEPGWVELFCAIHPHMNAHILVLPTRYFTMPDSQHRYRLADVPPGRYVIKAWHPLLEAKTQSVEVREGAPARADFRL